MNDVIIRTSDSSLLRDFADEVLAPPRDHLLALAAARRGGRKIDPLAALVRNALAAERQSRPVMPQTARRRPVSYFIPADIRAEYRTLFERKVAGYTAAGHGLEQARRLVTDDLGCVEFYAFVREREARPDVPPSVDHKGSEVRAA